MTLQWKDNWIRLLALCMAIILWFYVSIEQNPVTDMNINYIPLTIQDLPSGYVLEGAPETVNIRVRGNRSTTGLLHRSDFKTYLEIPAGVEPGQLTLPVQVLPPPGVEVTRVTPREVTVQIDQVITKAVPVVVNLTGDPAPGLQLDQPVVEPARVELQGPQKVLAAIDQVQVTVDIAGAGDTLERTVNISAPARGVTVQPARVTVTVPSTGFPVQNLAVQVDLTGELAPGYEMVSVTTDPPAVQVSGPENILQGLTVVKTEPVDISGLDRDLEQEVSLVLPAGINLLGSPQVLVTVQVNPGEETQPAPGGAGDSDQQGTGAETEN